MKAPLSRAATVAAAGLVLSISGALAKSLDLAAIREAAREIDHTLSLEQKEKKVAANPLCDDGTFLRRSYLGISGRLPTPDEAERFLNSADANKRPQLIETLVNSSGMDSRLFNYWSDLLRVQTFSEHHGLGWHLWLKDAVQKNRPYHQMVSEMLSAKGHTAENPAVGYYLRDRGMLLDNVSNTAQIFLGQQIGCAQCHDHPFDDYTQRQYYELTAYLGQTDYRFLEGRQKLAKLLKMDPKQMNGRLRPGMQNNADLTPKDRQKRRRAARQNQKEIRRLGNVFRFHQRNAVSENFNKHLTLPNDYKYEDGQPGDPVNPHFLFGSGLENTHPAKRRDLFAQWVTSPDNPYFTRVIANRMWDYVFGYGLVASLDDWSNAPDPAFPETLKLIEQTMRRVDYRIEDFLRILFHTQLFQRQAAAEAPQAGFNFDFSGPALRRMTAQEIRDSLVTLHHGVIDEKTDHSLERSRQRYVKAFRFLMGTNLAQLQEIAQTFANNLAKRQATNTELSKLRRAVKEAREANDTEKARKLQRQIGQVRRKSYNREGNVNTSTAVTKARAALTRRPMRRHRPDHPAGEMRSSELPAPAGGGSLQREFGASDRRTPDAAHSHASVPQILRLLNGHEAHSVLYRNGAFRRQLQSLKTAAERLDFLFLSFYSTYPTAQEKEHFLSETKTLTQAYTLARAMMTSNRFLFVQ